MSVTGAKRPASVPYLEQSRWPAASLSRGYHVLLGKMLQPAPSSPTDAPTPYLKAAHVQWGAVASEDLPEMYASVAERTQYAVMPGDLLVCEGGDVGRAAMVEGDLPAGTIIQNSLHRVRPRPGYSSRYLLYVLEAVHASGWLDALCNRATIAHLTREKLSALRIPAPAFSEQCAIAHYLDHETARIDALVAKKRRMIDALEERRTALTLRCVTRGLYAGATPKESGVDFLGAVPAHWQVAPLRRFWTVVDCKHRTATYVDIGIPIVSTTEVKPGRLDLRYTRMTSMEDYLDLTEDRLPVRGDIIYSRNASVGSAAYVDTDEPFCMGQDVCLITSHDQDQLFLSYLLNCPAVLEQLEAVMVGATFRRINVSQIKALWVLRPPIEEQRAIGRFLDEATADVNKLQEKLQVQIQSLLERRRVLITAAVTGQVDVSQVAA